MRTLIVTVGTSLLSNAGKFLGKRPDFHALLGFLKKTAPKEASAETNSIERILRKDDQMVFLCSFTEEGRLCAEALKAYYNNKDIAVRIKEIRDLNYAESRFKLRGLRALVAEMVQAVNEERQKGREVIINATGGFKAEIAYATLVGLLFDVTVYYIHERFREIIELPPVPIDWDFSIIAEYEDLFRWLNDDYHAMEEVDRRLSVISEQDRRKISVLLEEEEGLICLGPTGEALFLAYMEKLRVAENVAVVLSTKARQTLNGYPPEVRRSFESLLKKIRIAPLRRKQAHSIEGSDCLVFPSGHREERIFFFEEGGKVFVCEMTRHSDGSYQQILSQGVYRKNYRFEGHA